MTQRGSGKGAVSDDRKRSSGVVVSLLVLAFASLAANQWHDRQSIERVEVAGATTLSHEAVQQILTTCLQRERRALLLSDVRDSIQTIPFVRSATVYFSGVRGVTAEVQERTPVAHVVLDDGTLRYVDAEGVILPPTARATAQCLPVLRTADLESIPDMVAVLNQARSVLNPNLYASVSEVIEQPNGEVRILADDVTWFMGDPKVTQVRRSFADMNLFWDRAVRGRNLSQYAEIDLRWKHHIVIRNARGAARS